MVTNFSPSTNIIRDVDRKLDYQVTSNSESTALRILNDFKLGFHSFTIIGSFGTGKSSFLWAFEKSVSGKNKIFDLNLPKSIKQSEFIHIIGEYQSIEGAFYNVLEIKKTTENNSALFDNINDRLNPDCLLVIVIDEFGKFLEYAGQNEPEKEMYFIQQLAEFVNDPSKNILLLTTLHQSVDSYAYNLNTAQKNEWKKINGRFKELVFNEPIEQLLTLAAGHFLEINAKYHRHTSYSKSLISLQNTNHIFGNKGPFFQDIENKMYPLDIFSAFILTFALQKYGQNERSLFSFLQSESIALSKLKDDHYFNIADVYDYLYSNFYSFINSKANPDYAHWYLIKESIAYAEVAFDRIQEQAIEIIKIIGLFQIFGNKGSKIDDAFFDVYLKNKSESTIVFNTLEALTKKQIIRYNRFAQSYRLYEGSDFDIHEALNKAENQIEKHEDIVPKLLAHFNFPIEQAKAVSYKLGTPRLFQYVFCSVLTELEPTGEIDGMISLIFNSQISNEQVKLFSQKTKEAIIYAVFQHSSEIELTLFEIDKIDHVFQNIKDDGDKVAIRELESLKSNYIEQLNNQVENILYTDSVTWFFNGEQKTIHSKKDATKLLTEVCELVYTSTAILNNELINKHKVSAAIASARKSYFHALVKGYEQEDLGFPKDKYPPEKTIYISLLKNTGIHSFVEGLGGLNKPHQNESWLQIWQECENFIAAAGDERKSISELYEILQKRPYKMKLGVLDFWIPTFLFIRRGDYALYSEGTFKPYINEDELYLITRNPKHYTIKSFVLNDLRLSFFNKYRLFLHQKSSPKLNVDSFIESIRPILLMYRNLNDYAKTTKRISREAQRLRDSISKAQDLEKVFFDDFPSALGVDINELLLSEENFDNYIYQFQEKISEIKNAYEELLNRIEIFIQQEIFQRSVSFREYKTELQNRFQSLKEHQLLAQQKIFLQRLNSPINDRDSWIASISQTIIGRPLTQITDNDEEVLKDKFKFFIQELSNLLDIQKISVDSNNEEVFKIDFTSYEYGTKPHLVRISNTQIENAKTIISNIKDQLGMDREMRIALLAKMLKDELKK